MAWWIWVLLGFGLLGLELATTSIQVGFFGGGAIAVGIVVALGFGGPLWFQFVLFTVISLASLFFLRQKMLAALGLATPSKEIDTMVGEIATATREIGAGETGKSELRGTSWNTRNEGGATIPVGARCRVLSVDGLTLVVSSDELVQ